VPDGKKGESTGNRVRSTEYEGRAGIDGGVARTDFRSEAGLREDAFRNWSFGTMGNWSFGMMGDWSFGTRGKGRLTFLSLSGRKRKGTEKGTSLMLILTGGCSCPEKENSR
jgi:hypothetical protein